MAQLTFPILGVLDNTPDSVQKDFKFQVARNNGRGRIELKTSKDRGVTYKVLVPEIISSTTTGSILTVQDDGSAEWSRPKSNLVTVNGATLTVNRTMSLTGTSGTTYNLDDISINPGEVTLAMMANIDASAGIKVVGRSTASSGVPQVLSTSGTGNVAMTASPTFTGTLAAAAVTATSINGAAVVFNGNNLKISYPAVGADNLVVGQNISQPSLHTGNKGFGNGDIAGVSGNVWTYGSATAGTGGNVSTYAASGNNGGAILMYGGSSGEGGGIATSNGGGSIITTGTGSIGLGVVANRTYLVSTAGNNEKTATFPNVTGTVVVAATSATATQALFATATAGAPAYRAIATGDLPSIASGLTGILPGANGGTGVANTTKTITLGASLTTTGAGAATFALGASAQTYTFPTATATLASLTGTETLTNKTLTTPVLGNATATSINGITISAGGSGTLTMSIGGSINTGELGGTISTNGNLFYSRSGGYINTSSFDQPGGDIDTGGVGAAGGSINTYSGGGAINTRGNGSIGLGIVANRTYLVSTAGNNEKTATFPNVTGTVAVGAHSGTTTHAMFSAGAAGYTTRGIASADIATALATPTAPTARAALTGVTNVIAFSTGIKQSATMSAAATISSFTGGSDGATLELWVKGGASDFVLKCTPPSASDSLIDMVTTGKTITANKIWVLGFKYFANIAAPGWRLVSLVGGF